MFNYDLFCDVSELKGKTLTQIGVSRDNDEIYFHCNDGSIYKMFHDQECCEHVTIEDIAGDLTNLLHSPITMAEERCNESDGFNDDYESYTWTYYKLGTIKGYVTIRWYGSSNGYYSEKVNFMRVKEAVDGTV